MCGNMAVWLIFLSNLQLTILTLDSPLYLSRHDIKSSGKSLMTGKQCRTDPNELHLRSNSKVLGMERGRREEMGEGEKVRGVRKRMARGRVMSAESR